MLNRRVLWAVAALMPGGFLLLPILVAQALRRAPEPEVDAKPE